MPDITFDDLIKAKTASTADQPKASGGFLADLSQEGLIELGSMALNILQQFKSIQGKGGTVLSSRPPQEQTQSQSEASKPMVDIEQLKEALNMVKMAKGDINITSMLKLLEENKEMVAEYLEKV